MLGEQQAILDAKPLVLRVQTLTDIFDPDAPGQVQQLVRALDQLSTLLAGSLHARCNIGKDSNPSIWPVLHRLWFQTLSAHIDPEPNHVPHPELPVQITLLSTTLAKFTRNLVAQVPSNQQQAYQFESSIRKLVYHYTSFSAIQHPTSYPVTRMLAQALSNIITKNDACADRLWSTYLSLPEEQNILSRLFASPDARTVSATFVLVLNCVHGSNDRSKLLVEAARGPRTFLALLDRMSSLFAAEESSEEGRAFDIGYEVVSRIIESGISGDLYAKLAVEEEPIAPHQTTLLKLLDSYLHSSDPERVCDLALSRRLHADDDCLCNVLTHSFLAMSAYVQSSLRRALGPQGPSTPDIFGLNSTATDSPGSDAVTGNMSLNEPRVPSAFNGDNVHHIPLQEVDILLPKVCEGLVLVTGCLTTIALRAEEAAVAHPSPTSVHPQSSATSTSISPSPRAIMGNVATSGGQRFIESLIETLRLIDAFVPRITFGKVVQRPAAPVAHAIASDREEQGHRIANAPDTRLSESENELRAAAQAFAHVKRDLVRLLGILASQDRAVQDRVRGCGGIPVVMNLCVVDDHNPYLREHAILALRNILAGNLENQAVVDAVRPVGRWDEDKMLRELRGDAVEA
ncbi:spinocerebellar ataxia type 10 protein domain-containing protein [Fomes fomentarius]|nr:spinocerebellar ataxia type 10 protein domain-containing protein [Fomes fomentarius]